MLKHTELKRWVKGNSKEGRLFVSDVDGARYATNSYWLTPADVVKPLLAHFNLDTEPRSYRVNGSVEPTDQEPPNLTAILDYAPNGPVTLEPAQYAGQDVFTRLAGADGYVQLFDRVDDGTSFVRPVVALNVDYVGLLHAAADALQDRYERRERFEYRQDRNKPLGPVAVYAVGTRSEPACNYADQSKRPADRPYETFCGLVMPVRIS